MASKGAVLAGARVRGFVTDCGCGQMEKPEAGRLKCNFDGAWKEQGKKGGIGVVFRDDMGPFVAAMAMKMEGISSPMLAENHTRRDTNKVAHRLAQVGLTLNQRRVWFESLIS
ncbi:hypothetical protein DVH24_038093 [Malus domestica]|uniref:RNase H type-1 domain-containing protein n=1 Tax=Malus domestica TaxID=3750 RepID=A0A498K6C8_MALDO|nr:hypothetical protein DVH24_038093 [Malus domestica]